MTLVFPLLLGGLGLVVIPIVIHLIRQQKPKTVKFPAFRFLVQRRKTNLRKLRLRHLLLLLLRMAVLILICVALAKPKVISQALNLRADRPVLAVLVFDTSFSMEYKITGGQNRLEDAKKRGLELLGQLPQNSKVAVLNTAEPAVLGKSAFTSMAEARRRIQSLELRYDSASVTARLQDAYRLLGEMAEGKEEPAWKLWPRFVCVFSDAQRASWDEGELPRLYELQDAVPPSLQRMQALQKVMSGRLALLKELRQQLPPPVGADFPEQELIELWSKLEPKVDGALPDEFPDAETMKWIARFRDGTRQLVGRLRAYKMDDLPESAKSYRQKVLEMLLDTQTDMQGVYGVYVNVGVDKAADLAVLRLDFPRDPGTGTEQQVFAPEQTLTLRAVVQATGQDFDTKLVCEVGEQRLSVPVILGAGEQTVVPFKIACDKLAPGPQKVEVHFSQPDLLDFTNRRFATFAVRQSRKVLIVTDRKSENVKVWKVAIESKTEYRFSVDVMHFENFAKIKPDRLATYQAVYVIHVANPTTQPNFWPTLRNYVERGFSIAIAPAGADMAKEGYNEGLAKDLLPGTFQKVVTVKDGFIWHWANQNVYKHPLFQRFRGWRIGGVKFFRVPRRAYKYWLVEPYPNVSQVLVRYDDVQNKPKTFPPAVLERDLGKGKGKVVLLTTRMDQAAEPWNNYLEFDTHFVAAWPGELTRYLAGDATQDQFNFISGQEIPQLRLPVGITKQMFTIQGPDLFDSTARVPDATVLSFPKAIAPGHYDLRQGPGVNEAVIGSFSVNLPAREMDMKRVPLSQIEDFLGRNRVVTLTHQMQLNDILQEHWSEPVALFPWLMIGLLLVLTLENLLSNLFYRRQPQES